MTHDEEISKLKVDYAVLNEKVKRLEWIIYGVIGFAVLQLLGLFILWAKQIIYH